MHRKDPRLAERWDLVAFGAELGTAYSELIDPIDQRDRLVRQSLKAANGDCEAMQVDEAFLTALEYAMPLQRRAALLANLGARSLPERRSEGLHQPRRVRRLRTDHFTGRRRDPDLPVSL